MWSTPREPPQVDLGLDLGSTRLRAITREGVLVVDQPSCVAWEEGPSGRRVIAVGDDALARAGTPGVRVVQPVRGGAWEDWAGVEQLARHALAAAGLAGRAARVLVAVPGDATETERRALDASLRAAGASATHRVDAVLAAAVGIGAPLETATGSMIVAIGGGRTEAAVLTLDGVAVRRALRVAGEAMDTALVQWLRRQHQVLLPASAAERLKHDVGAARPLDHLLQTRIRARDLGSGQPVLLDVEAGHTAEAMREVVDRIVAGVVEVLRETPPELSADVLERGVLLVGGGARLRGLDAALREATGLVCLLVDEPERAVVAGLGKLLRAPERLRAVEDEPQP